MNKLKNIIKSLFKNKKIIFEQNKPNTPNLPELIGSTDTVQKSSRNLESLIEEKTRAWQDQQLADNHLNSSGKKPKGDFIPIVKRIASFIPEKSKVIDVGCGHGRLSFALAELGYHVTATDVSERMLQLLNENKAELQIVVKKADAHRLPADDKEYDAVVSADFMPHFPDWPKLLGEKSRVCRIGGLVIFGFNFKEHRDYCDKLGIPMYDHPYTPEIDGTKPFWAETTLDEMRAAGENCGLKIVDIVPVKFISDNFLFGGTLGITEYAKLKKETLEFFKNSKALEEYNDWINYNLFQKLPYFTSYHSLVVFEKFC